MSFGNLWSCRTIVIDAGKTFQAAAVEWFPKYGLRTIDALLITHAHADGENLSLSRKETKANLSLLLQR